MRRPKPVPVIFRIVKDTREVIALFPTLPYGNDILTCTSYMHVGQHGAATFEFYSDNTRKCINYKQYSPLLHELRSIGYDVRVCVYWTKAHKIEARGSLYEKEQTMENPQSSDTPAAKDDMVTTTITYEHAMAMRRVIASHVDFNSCSIIERAALMDMYAKLKVQTPDG